MTISGISGSSQKTSSGTASTALSANYEMFLTLLTTQIRNQSPLDPMDANQFTQQLVQYSAIEQQIQTNSNLEEMKSSLAISNATSLVNYIGTTVTADSSQTTLQNGSAKWNFSMAKAGTADITVKNAAGEVVYTASQAYGAGTAEFGWNGKTSNGVAAEDGTYTIDVAAKDAAGNKVAVTTEITGRVSALDFTWASPTSRSMASACRSGR